LQQTEPKLLLFSGGHRGVLDSDLPRIRLES
jgi:hypothetical protein